MSTLAQVCMCATTRGHRSLRSSVRVPSLLAASGMCMRQPCAITTYASVQDQPSAFECFLAYICTEFGPD